MKYFRAFFVLILPLFWVGCGNESEKKESSVDLAMEKSLNSPQLGQGQKFWREYDYARAVEQYLGQDLEGHPKLLLERGQLLLRAGMFYRTLGNLAAELSSDLLAIRKKGQDRGDMKTQLLSCLAAIEAYERGDYSSSVSLLQKIEEDQAPSVMGDPARLAVAASHLRLGNEAEGREILQKLQRQGAGDAVLAMQIYRRRVELGEIDLLEEDAPIWKPPGGELLGGENAGLVDLAWIFLQRGEVDNAFQALQRFNPRLPLAEEPFDFQVEEGSDLARQFYVVSFLPLMAQIHFLLASEDIRKVIDEEGEVGLYAAHMLGITLREAGETEPAEKAFEVFIDRAQVRDEDTDLKSYLEFLMGLSQIYRGSILWENDQPEEARRLWNQVIVGQDLRHLALQAALIYERTRSTGRMPPSEDLEGLQRKLIRANSSRYRGYESEYFRTASLKLSMCMRNMREEDFREKAVRLLEKLSGGDTKNADARLRVEMARAYFAYNKNDWSQGKKLITGMIPHADVCFPVSEIYGYVLADFARLKPNDITEGDN